MPGKTLAPRLFLAICALGLGLLLAYPAVYFLMPGTAAAQGSADGDRAALVALYDATDGDNWTQNDNWKSNLPLDQWYGVETSRDGRVIHLRLYSNNLAGSIPAELGNLTYLSDLSLYRNKLYGRIPSQLGNLRRLEHLKLYRNELSGNIPASLGNLSYLTVLNLAVNDLSGNIPTSVGNLSGVTELNLHSNGLSGSIPQNLSDLSKLNRLQLRNNSFSGCIPADLYGVEDNDLNQLGLSKCSTAPQPPGDVTNFTAVSGNNAGEVVLRWTPGANATEHQVWYRPYPDRWVHWSSALAGDATGATVTGLSTGVWHKFAISAVRGEARSSWIYSGWVTPGEGQRPGDVTNFTAASGENGGEVVLRWTPGTNATGHKLYYQPYRGSWGSWVLWSSTLAGDATGTTVTGLNTGVRYRFALQAVRGELGSSWIRSETTTDPLGDPWNLRAAQGRHNGQVVLRWTPGANATGHKVYYKPHGGDWAVWSSSLAGDARETTVNGLDGGQEYLFYISAYYRSRDGSLERSNGLLTRALAAPADWVALMRFYYSTHGGWEWDGCSKWGEAVDIGAWCGVTVDGNGRVIKLELPGRIPKYGALPWELDQLTELRVLNLSGNSFRGDIKNQNPDHSRGIDWQNLENLVELDLSNNKRCGGLLGCRHGLSGSVWVFAYLPNLDKLDLSGNELNSGAQFLLEYDSPMDKESAAETIEMDLSDNPWDREPKEYRDYWKGFKGGVTRGFVTLALGEDSNVGDLIVTVANKKYPILKVADQKSLTNFYAEKRLKQIKVRAAAYVPNTGTQKVIASLFMKSGTIALKASNLLGWVIFTIDVAEIALNIIEAAIEGLKNGPGAVIKDTSDRFLGIGLSCLLSEGYYDEPPPSAEKKRKIEDKCRSQ